MRLSVIVPTLNEERVLESCLDSVSRGLLDNDFIVISDGGSEDRTREIAQRFQCELISVSRGRGQQLDAGAHWAIKKGADILLFLHADSRLPQGWRTALEEAAPAVGGGCLIEFCGATGLHRHGSRLVNWRTRRYRRPLGDQGQFATASAYQECGGFPHWPILEDTKFRQELEKIGPLTIVPIRIETDSRRFERRGAVRTVVNNWLIWLLYWLGVNPNSLARLYRNIR